MRLTPTAVTGACVNIDGENYEYDGYLDIEVRRNAIKLLVTAVELASYGAATWLPYRRQPTEENRQDPAGAAGDV
jgi:hypothetical protein